MRTIEDYEDDEADWEWSDALEKLSNFVVNPEIGQRVASWKITQHQYIEVLTRLFTDWESGDDEDEMPE